jgi:beta-glucosidase
VYVGDPASTGEPPKQLEGYQKVFLNPGQSKRVTVALSHRAFAYWNAATNDWRVAPGCYSLMVGTSSTDLPLQVQMPQGGGVCYNERPNNMARSAMRAR